MNAINDLPEHELKDIGEQFRQYLSQTERFQSYLYSYPHKTAYRPFDEPVDLQALWVQEKKSSLYLYTHIPFCQMKCAFCNLFTVSHPQEELVTLYLKQLQTQAQVMRETLAEFHFSGYAVGGGTPSHLDTAQLAQLFAIYSETLGLDLQHTPGSFEISPDTITEDKLALLAQYRVQRISIGIQSFIEAEARAVGRIQPAAELEALLEKIKHFDFPSFNIDLIYGLAGQTPESWLASLKKALQFAPTELFLYPLYVRPLTALFRNSKNRAGQQDDIRTTLYQIGRDFLLANGYQQDSMRLFRRSAASPARSGDYTCQEDGMIGLGTNARSYTRDVHYSTEYAVAKPQVAAIIAQYIAQKRSDFASAHYGIRLSEDDRKRRYLIKSLLKSEGIDRAHYQTLFGTALYSDFPELPSLIAMNLAAETGTWLRLQGDGMAYSDLIGHWFISPEVKQKMQSYTIK